MLYNNICILVSTTSFINFFFYLNIIAIYNNNRVYILYMYIKKKNNRIGYI